MKKQKLLREITVDPTVRFGKPIIAGTRIPVEIIVGKIAGGMSIDEVKREYDLTTQQVRAALKYAAELVELESVAFA